MEKTFAVLGLLGIVSAAQANLVQNGDFAANASSYTTSPGYNGGGSNPASPTDWTAPTTAGVNGPGISTPFGPAVQTHDDLNNPVQYYSFLQGNGSSESQSIGLAANTQYTLTFDAAARNGNPSGASSASVTASLSGAPLASPVSDTVTVDNTEFHFETLTFQTGSTAGPVTLTFANASAPGDTTVDVTNVTLNSTPEPASLGLLGIGALGLLARRRRIGF